MRQLRRAGERKQWIEEDPTGPDDGPGLDPVALDGDAERALAQAAAAGFDVHLQVYPIGALAATIRLDDHQLLAPTRTDWVSVFGGAARPSELRIDVVAPDGTLLFSEGNGDSCFGCSSTHVGATPGRPLPAQLAGATRLTITIDDRTVRPRLRTSVKLDCGSDPAPRTVRGCDTVIRDRYALLPPMPSDMLCAGSPAASVAIKGHLGGVAIHARYGADRCSFVGKRWLRDLRDARVLPETAASRREAREERRPGRVSVSIVSE